MKKISTAAAKKIGKFEGQRFYSLTFSRRSGLIGQQALLHADGYDGDRA